MTELDAAGAASDEGVMAGASATTIAADPSRAWSKQVETPQVTPSADADFERKWSAAMGEEPPAAPAGAAEPAEADAPSATPAALPGDAQATTPVLETVKAAGFSAAEVNAALVWLDSGPTQTAGELAAIDATDRAAAQTALVNLWGDRIKENVAAINFLLDTLPAGAAFTLRNGRTADGRAFANDPAVLQRLLGVAQKAAKASNGAPAAGDAEATIRELENYMRRSRYTYDRDEVAQARLRAAYAARGH